MLINHLKDNFDKAKKLHQKGDLISAISIYLEILKIDKNNSIISFYLGTAYLQSGAFENSIKYLEKSLKLFNFGFIDLLKVPILNSKSFLVSII